MRISKKFVGSNCIGKQVFRRRQADMDRLQPADIERSRSQLADLERRFLERVAMTNRCKTGGEIGSKEGGRDFDLLRPQQPPPATQPWMLPPSPPSSTVPFLGGAPQADISVGGAPSSSVASAGVPLLNHTRGGVVASSSTMVAQAAGDQPIVGPVAATAATTGALQRSSTTLTPATPATSATAALTAATPSPSGVGSGHAHSVPANGAAEGLVLGGPPEKESQHRPLAAQQQQPNAQGGSITAVIAPSRNGVGTKPVAAVATAPVPASSAATETAGTAGAAASALASASASAPAVVATPASFLDAKSAAAVVVPKQEPVARETAGLSVRTSASGANSSNINSNVNINVNGNGAIGSNGIDRTTSLEALSLLELPHIQGMTNLAVLGLWPTTLPASAGSAGTASTITATSSTSGSGTPLKSLTEGSPVSLTTNGNGAGSISSNIATTSSSSNSVSGSGKRNASLTHCCGLHALSDSSSSSSVMGRVCRF
ncbi:unnamed protein product [Scytosiphon promiscuus]